MAPSLQVQCESTPNPQALRFVFSAPIYSKTLDFANVSEAVHCELAKKLFGFPWVERVYIAPNFITLTKQDWVEWDILQEPLSQMLLEHLNADDGRVRVYDFSAACTHKTNEEVAPIEESPESQQIRRIIEEEVRPAVAMDGGDILFEKYEEGVVYVALHGACQGCPSSTMTLQEGVKKRLQESLPQIQAVVPV